MEERVKNSRLSQVWIYLGKCFRIFRYEKGWKVILFGAVISAIIAWVPGSEMFVHKQQTKNGAFAIVCACIWIGLFNSIQSICRERKIIKREHRTGLHISSYVLAHMIYELCLCMIQSLIMVIALLIFRSDFPAEGVLFPAVIEIYISCLLTMYAADVLGIAVSSFVKTENAAMAAMPFVLIVQLVLAGTIFELSGSVEVVSNVTISKWAVEAIGATCDVNHMEDSFTLIQVDEEIAALEDQQKEIDKKRKELKDQGLPDDDLEDIVIDEDEITEKYLDKQIEDEDRTDPAYDHTVKNVCFNWAVMAVYAILYGIVSVAALEFVDRDKR